MSRTFLDKNGLTYFWSKIKSLVNTHTTPTGSITMFSGSVAPNGWLICDGSNVSRTTYADLFNIIGTNYGNGDGSTTFTLPNFKGRVPVGKDTNDTDFDTLGETGGNKTDDLSNAYAKVGRSSSDYNALQYKSKAESGSFNRKFTANNKVIGGSGDDITDATELGGSVSRLQPYQVVNYIIKY